MTETAIQQVTTEDIKQAILALIRENNAEFKAILQEIPAKIKESAAPKQKKTKAAKTKEIGITIVEGSRLPYSEMPFWKANPHLHARAQAFREKNCRPANGNVAEAFKKAQEAFSDLNVTDEEWRLQIQD